MRSGVHVVIGVVLAPLLCAACVPAARTVPPGARTPTAAAVTPTPPDTVAADRWWRMFGAPALDTLVAAALAGSTDIQVSAARLAEARATWRGTNANNDPSLDPTLEWTRSKVVIGNFGAISTTVASLSNRASWEVDLFGRLRQERSAAAADGIAAAYDLADVRRTTVAQVVRGYVDVLSFTQQVAVLEAQLEARRVTRGLEASRARAGLSARTDSIRAEAAEHEVTSQLPGVRAQRGEALGDLAALTGRSVAWVDSVVRTGTRALDDGPSLPAEGIPVDVLRARPDVRAAEARVVAAAARVQVARKALLPSLSLVGTTGRNRTNDSGWVPTWSFGPSLSLTLPTRAGRAQVDVRRAQLVQREAEWRAAVQEAVVDAEVAFTRVRLFASRVEEQRQVVRVYRDLNTVARTRWTSGLADFRDVLEAQRSQLQAERGLVEQWTAYAKAVVTLYQATGLRS